MFTVALAALANAALAQGVPTVAQAVHALAPTGSLRVAINFGNVVLAQRALDGTPRGVSVVLATELAHRLGVPLAIVPYAQAGMVTDALGGGAWDVCFLAADPVRGQGIDFTAPYVLIEGAYAVLASSGLATVEAVDNEGTGIAVARGSAYDLYLTRSLKHASLVRYTTNAEAAAALLDGRQQVLAGVRQPLETLAAAHPTVRVIPGRFMSIEQTMGTPKSRDPAALATLQAFLVDAKRSGLVQRALDDTNQPDAEVAP